MVRGPIEIGPFLLLLIIIIIIQAFEGVFEGFNILSWETLHKIRKW